MNIQELLTNKECSCGQRHTCDIKSVVIEKGAIERVADYTGNYKNILLVADQNTYAVCGDKVKELLGKKLQNVLVYSGEVILIPNEAAIEKMQNMLRDTTDLIIGIGSGVIQDLCKYVSFYNKLSYFIIATAPSMDGYASKGAAMITGNMKVTYNTHVPEVIIGDTDILKNAPIEMIKSGYGDILGKFSCLNDWKLSHVINDEYICNYVYDLTYEMLMKTKDLGPKLLERDDEAVKTLTEALIGVGIAMAYAGNSRPASGSEHHLSHFFEVIGIMKNEPYFMHGIDVAYSAVYTQKLREELLSFNEPPKAKAFNKGAWETKIREVYFAAAEGVIELQNKLGWYNQNNHERIAERWDIIKEVLSEVPTAKELIGYLSSVGLDIADFKEMYAKEKIENAIKYAKDLKDRYSVLWLYNSLV